MVRLVTSLYLPNKSAFSHSIKYASIQVCWVCDYVDESSVGVFIILVDKTLPQMIGCLKKYIALRLSLVLMSSCRIG